MRSKGIERDGTNPPHRNCRSYHTSTPTGHCVYHAYQTNNSINPPQHHNNPFAPKHLRSVVVFNAAIDSISKIISFKEWKGNSDEMNGYVAKIFDLLDWMDRDGIGKDDYTYDTVRNHANRCPPTPASADSPHRRPPAPTSADQRPLAPTSAHQRPPAPTSAHQRPPVASMSTNAHQPTAFLPGACSYVHLQQPHGLRDEVLQDSRESLRRSSTQINQVDRPFVWCAPDGARESETNQQGRRDDLDHARETD